MRTTIVTLCNRITELQLLHAELTPMEINIFVILLHLLLLNALEDETSCSLNCKDIRSLIHTHMTKTELKKYLSGLNHKLGMVTSLKNEVQHVFSIDLETYDTDDSILIRINRDYIANTSVGNFFFIDMNILLQLHNKAAKILYLLFSRWNNSQKCYTMHAAQRDSMYAFARYQENRNLNKVLNPAITELNDKVAFLSNLRCRTSSDKITFFWDGSKENAVCSTPYKKSLQKECSATDTTISAQEPVISAGSEELEDRKAFVMAEAKRTNIPLKSDDVRKIARESIKLQLSEKEIIESISITNEARQTKHISSPSNYMIGTMKNLSNGISSEAISQHNSYNHSANSTFMSCMESDYSWFFTDPEKRKSL